MTLTKFTGAINTIQSLADKPNQDGGLTAAQLKLKFDQSAIDNEAYLNDTLTVELDTLDAENVKKTGDQTIQGVKTFEVSPIIPTPTTDMQASTKKYVDDMGTSKTNNLNTHKTSSDHDSRYYTETESDSKFETITDLTNTRKLSPTGDFTGSWFGITNPAYADPGIAGVVAEHTLQLAEIVQARTNPYKLTKTLNKMFSGSSAKIVAYGDSTTYGDTGAGRSTTPYPETMQAKLQSIYNNNNIQVINKGVNGRQSDEALANFDSLVVSQSPDAVIIMFGINDASGAVLPSNTLEQYRSNIIGMVKKCYQQGYEVLLMPPTPTYGMFGSPSYWNNATNRKIYMYGKAVEEIAKSYNCGFFNLHDEIEKLYNSKAESIKTMLSSADYVHFNDYGYVKIAEIITSRVFDLRANGTLIIDSIKDLFVPVCRSKYIDTDCTVDYISALNNQEFFGRHYSLSSDGVGGTYTTFEFFVGLKGIDLIMLSPKNENSGKIDITDNGVIVATIDGFSNEKSLFDVENIIVENMAIGYHKIELKTSNMTQGQAISTPYYASISAFKFTKTKAYNHTLYTFNTLKSTLEKMKSIIQGTLRFIGVASNTNGLLLNDSDYVELKPNKTMIFEVAGTFFDKGGLTWFGNIAGGDNSKSLNPGYILVLATTKVDLYHNTGTNNTFTILNTYTTTIDFGVEHKIRIEHKYDGVIKIYLDGTLIITTAVDLTAREGYFGLYSQSITTSKTMEINRFEYCYIDTP